MTPAQFEEGVKVHRHNEQMRLAAQLHKTPIICPDCYAPPAKCKHERPYDRRKI